MAVWYAGWNFIPPCIPDSHPYRITITKCRMDSYFSWWWAYSRPNHVEKNIYTYLLHGAGFLLEKLTGLQLVKKCPAFYGTRRFLTALTSARHLSLSCASPIHSSHPHPTSWRSILTLSSHQRLGLPSALFPSGFPTRTLYTPLPPPIRIYTKKIAEQVGFIYKIIQGSTVNKA
jgi:hypothetical protein